MQKRVFLKGILATALTGALQAHAMGTASGPAVVGYAGQQGPLGIVEVNPYGVAPLTAVIRNGGYELLKAHVRVVPKKDGQEIAYDVSRHALLTHGGIPVFGLYADYANQVEVDFTYRFDRKDVSGKHTYTIWCGPVRGMETGAAGQRGFLFDAEVKKVDPAFADRLYLVNNIGGPVGANSRVVWNNPMGGALTWNFQPQIAIIDTTGEVRWYLDAHDIWDPNSIYSAGCMMGFRQNTDGAITWGYGQRYAKYDLIGGISRREL